jgi:hypothetical protein
MKKGGNEMASWEMNKQRVEDAAKQFPAEFGLRAFPGDVFRISLSASYVNDSDVVTLYTQIKKGDRWLDFAKGSVNELKRELVKGR